MHDDAQYLVAEDRAIPTPGEEKLAPWWHTLAILLLFVLWTIAGSHRAQGIATDLHTFRYVGSAMAGWMLLGTVVAGVYHRRSFFRGTLLRNARPWYVEGAIGFGVWLSVLLLLGCAQVALQHTRFALPVDRTIVRAMAPQSWTELALWFCVSFTAGFCEEHVFRGYLLPQSITALRRVQLPRGLAYAISIVAVSTLFGVLHLYQGVGGAVMISILGIMYCCFALYFGNLRALIVAHFLQDFITGAVLFARHLHGK